MIIKYLRNLMTQIFLFVILVELWFRYQKNYAQIPFRVSAVRAKLSK